MHRNQITISSLRGNSGKVQVLTKEPLNKMLGGGVEPTSTSLEAPTATPLASTFINSESVLLAAVLLLLICGLWVYIYAKSKKPKFDRRGHPLYLADYANVMDLEIFNPIRINDSSIKNDVYDVYDPSTYKLGDTSVFIGYFDDENRSEDSPGTYPRMVKQYPIEGILKYNHTDPVDRLKMQYITHLYDDNSEIAHYFAENCINTLKTIMKKYKIHSREIKDVNVDIHTNPWFARAKFNCVDRWSVVLHGHKELVLFKIRRESKQSANSYVNYVKYILNQLSDSSLSNAEEHLNLLGIRCKRVTLNPRDLLYLPAGTFYIEESLSNASSHTITLNLDVMLTGNVLKECEYLFGSLWSRSFDVLEHYPNPDNLTIR